MMPSNAVPVLSRKRVAGLNFDSQRPTLAPDKWKLVMLSPIHTISLGTGKIKKVEALPHHADAAGDQEWHVPR
jgi:hypothetical protein